MDQARYISMNPDGNPYCNICKKVATEWHIVSGHHIKMMEEVAISDAMGGQTSSGFRRFGKLCEGCPTKRLMMNHWGENITYLPEFGKKIHSEKKAFYINSKLEKPLTVEEATYELGIVSYTGAGKYNDSTYIPYHELPDCEETATAEQLFTNSPPGQGWWPVLSLGEEYDKVNGRSVLLVCFYQLQLVEAIVPVWRIWPNWIAARQVLAPKAKARPQSGAASSSTSPPQPPTGVWAEAEMDLDETAPSCRLCSNKTFASSGICMACELSPTTAPPQPPTRGWADAEDDPNVEMDEVW